MASSTVFCFSMPKSATIRLACHTPFFDFEVDTDVLRLADLVDANDDGVAVGSALDGDVLLTFSNGASVELNGVQNPKIDTLAELAQFITVDFG